MSTSPLMACFEKVRDSLAKIEEIQLQYKQGRELYNRLTGGEVVEGTLYLQPHDPQQQQTPLQLPMPDKETLAALLTHGSQRLNDALQLAWAEIAAAAAEACNIITPPAPAAPTTQRAAN